MKKIWNQFQNRSLWFKIVVLLFLLVMAMQIVNGLVFNTIVSDKFKNNIMESNQSTVKQMTTNTNRLLKDVIKEMIPIREEISGLLNNEKDQNAARTYVSRSISYQEHFNKLVANENNFQFINSLLILEESGRNYCYTLSEYMKVREGSLYQKVMKDYAPSGQCYWGNVIDADYYFTSGNQRLLSIIMPVYRYNEIQQLVIVNLDVEAIEEYLEDLNEEQSMEHQLLLQISDKSLLHGVLKEEDLLKNEEILQIMGEQNREEIVISKDYNVITEALELNDWQLSMVIPQSSIRNTVSTMTQFITVIIVTSGIIMVAGAVFVVYTITKPIQKMTAIMEENRRSKTMDHRFHAKYRDEVGVLANTYNQLMDEISVLLEQIQEEQIQNRKAYFKLLQLQIKPHFLYNTLESAKFLVEMNDPKGIEMLTTIGKFYKLSLSGIYDKVKVREEIEHLTYYLKILQMRYSSKYDYEIQVPEELMEQEIVKFTMQPLVENAVYHGIKQQRKKGFVRITGELHGGYDCLHIWDNGAGIPKDKLEDLKQQIADSRGIDMREHIGILNVHQRLQVQYGEDYGLTIESTEGEFTCITVKIPHLTESKDSSIIGK